jgi:hypothetical protein
MWKWIRGGREAELGNRTVREEARKDSLVRVRGRVFRIRNQLKERTESEKAAKTNKRRRSEGEREKEKRFKCFRCVMHLIRSRASGRRRLFRA